MGMLRVIGPTESPLPPVGLVRFPDAQGNAGTRPQVGRRRPLREDPRCPGAGPGTKRCGGLVVRAAGLDARWRPEVVEAFRGQAEAITQEEEVRGYRERAEARRRVDRWVEEGFEKGRRIR